MALKSLQAVQFDKYQLVCTLFMHQVWIQQRGIGHQLHASNRGHEKIEVAEK